MSIPTVTRAAPDSTAPTPRPGPGRRASRGAGSWPRSCAAAGSGSPRRTSACRPRPGGARRACAARRWPRWPGSASPGTRGWSRAGTSTSRRRCWTPCPAPCCSTRTSACTCSGWPRCRTAAPRATARPIPPTVAGAAGQAGPVPGRGAQRPLRHRSPSTGPMSGSAASLGDLPFEDRNALWRAFTAPVGAGRDGRLGGGDRADGGRVPGRDGRARRRAGLEVPGGPAEPRPRRSSRRSGTGTRWPRRRTGPSGGCTRRSGCSG